MHPSKRLALGFSVVVVLLLTIIASVWRFQPDSQTTFGITFSSFHVREFDLKPIESYQDILTLGVKDVRLPLYWSDIEIASGIYDWSLPDELLKISADNNVKITLVLGQRVPRWPECFIPEWMTDNKRNEALLDYLKVGVERYRDHPEVIRFQIENEPFLSVFGECPAFEPDVFLEEINLVRSLTKKPIQITASGELSWWIPEAFFGDILGISLYRKTWNSLVGYVEYPMSPLYYRTHMNIVPQVKVIVSELQAEPWFYTEIRNRTFSDWYETFTATDFEKNIRFSKDTKASEVYLWGAEWWYLLHLKGDDRLWNTAIRIWQK